MAESVDFRVDGMSCSGCSSRLEKALVATDGVTAASVTLDPGKAEVQYDPAKTGPDALRDVIEDQGFDIVA